MSALADLLTEIVDYAGLFPPASLPLSNVVENYRRYRASDQAWMLGRLIVPAGQLDQLAEIAGDEPRPRWKISALLPAWDAPDQAFSHAAQEIDRFNRSAGVGSVDSVEVRVDAPQQVGPLVAHLAAGLNVFLEVPADNPGPFVAAMPDRQNVYAKIRTGGVTADLIPQPNRVARFIRCCADARRGWKATAGLHHPLRAEQPLTYRDDSPRAVMHGFLNVFLAAGFAWSGRCQLPQLESVLSECRASAFHCTPTQIGWRDHFLKPAEIRQLRGRFAISFGSCSFQEPVGDLARLGWLAHAAPTA